jgi:hypothetical protein
VRDALRVRLAESAGSIPNVGSDLYGPSYVQCEEKYVFFINVTCK